MIKIIKKEVDVLKKLVTEAPVLKIFDQKLPTKVKCNASSTGMGPIHGESWFPINSASHSLTVSGNYCQLEKGTLY